MVDKLSRRHEATTLLLIALSLLASLAQGQGATPAGAGAPAPFSAQGAGGKQLGTSPLRIWYRSKGYGEETSETAIGSHFVTPWDYGQLFLDGQVRFDLNEGSASLNTGTGYRWLNDGLMGTEVLGASAWYDGDRTLLGSWLNQAGVSFERLGQQVDLRFNANIPFEKRRMGGPTIVSPSPFFRDSFLFTTATTASDVPLRVVDFEVAPRLFDLNVWAYAGAYQMDGIDVSAMGAKGGVRGYVYNDLVVDVGVTDDKCFGTNTFAQVIWTPGRTSSRISDWSHRLGDRMRDQVYRNMYVASKRDFVVVDTPLTNAAGQQFRFVHVDSAAAAGGDGTFETPLNAISDVQTNSQTGDIVLAYSGSTFTGQTVTLQDSQRFLGEGGNNNHTIVTQQLGTINIPATSTGSIADAIPIIQNAAGDAIILAGTSTAADVAPIEVSNLSITGGTRGITSPTGVGNANINRVRIANTTGNGIDLTPLNAGSQALLAPSLSQLVFNNVGGDDIHIDGTTGQTTNGGTITIANYTSTSGNGTGIVLDDVRRAAAISAVNWTGGANGVGALLIKDATADANVTLSGTNTITGGKTTATDTQGYGIRLENSAGTHTVTGTTINNTGGDSVQVQGGSAGLAYTGVINKNNAGSVLQVDGGHTGNLSFTAATAGGNVVNATNGDGLQFIDADGVYSFPSSTSSASVVRLNGGQAAIDIESGSTGSIAIGNGVITNPNDIAVRVNGGSASLLYTGDITQSTNAQPVVSVTGGHTGTLRFTSASATTGGIDATTGTGLQFNGADGTYIFAGRAVLHGGDAGIDAVNSDGIFDFQNTDITNPTGTAVTVSGMNGINAAFTFNGDIVASSGLAVDLQNNTGGNVVFTTDSTITSTGQGIRSTGNTDLATVFAGAVMLDTTANTGVAISNNTNGSTQFNNIDIETTLGTGFSATGNASHRVSVLNAGNTIQTTSGKGLVLNNVGIGNAGVRFDSVSTSGAINGIDIQNVTGGAITVGPSSGAAGSGGTIVNSSAEAILVRNAANVTLNRLSVTGTTGANALRYETTTAATSRLSLNNNDFASAAGDTVSLSVTGAATAANITLANNTITNASGNGGLDLTTGTAAASTVNFLMDANGVTNNSATDHTINIVAGANTTLNATVTDNTTITNSNATPAEPFAMETLATSIGRLNLNGNDGTAASGNIFLLTETGGTFEVVDRDNVSTNNSGDAVSFNPNIGAFDDITAGDVPTP